MSIESNNNMDIDKLNTLATIATMDTTSNQSSSSYSSTIDQSSTPSTKKWRHGDRVSFIFKSQRWPDRSIYQSITHYMYIVFI